MMRLNQARKKLSGKTNSFDFNSAPRARFKVGNIYRFRRKEWDLVASYLKLHQFTNDGIGILEEERNLSSTPDNMVVVHEFYRLAENGYEYSSGPSNARFHLCGIWKGLSIEEVPLSDLPLYVSYEHLYPAYGKVLRGL